MPRKSPPKGKKNPGPKTKAVKHRRVSAPNKRVFFRNPCLSLKFKWENRFGRPWTRLFKMHVQQMKLEWDAKAPSGKGGLYRTKAAKPAPVEVKDLKYNAQPNFWDSCRSSHHLGMTKWSKMYKTMEDMGYDGGCDST